MKKILLLVAASLLAFHSHAQNPRAAAQTTQIVTAKQQSNDRSPEISLGFSDSSFEYGESPEKLKPENKTICYVGEATQVCRMIRLYADSMNDSYSRGNHDRIYIHSCEVVRDTVKTNYWLTDDYGGDWRINRDIKSCE